jgi:hypothetical protein
LTDNKNIANRFIAKLSDPYRNRFIASCVPVELQFADQLHQVGDVVSHVYFPNGSYISQVAQVDRRAVEVSLVGDEGMYGIHVGLGVLESPVRSIVQGGGSALRMPVPAFRRHLEKSAELRQHLAAYTYVAYGQAVQTAACNRFHVVEQRLARWLLMTADRAHSLMFHVTQSFLATMLGVRRVGVTNAASELQARGLIQYARGRVQIIDIKALRHVACSCYRSDLARYERHFDARFASAEP